MKLQIAQVLMLLGVTISQAHTECILNCGLHELPDVARCLCTPKLNCTTQPIDMQNKCHGSGHTCQSQAEANECPEKCFCSEPSVLNHYCPACLNGGVRDYLTNDGCQCRCFNGYQGSRCQYKQDPCEADDEPMCSKIDCYNATVENFFKCQRKCLCCKNKACYNHGIVKADCTCECLKMKGATLYDATSDCQTRITETCTDDVKCGSHFKVYEANAFNCKFDLVKHLCPQTCGVC